MHTYAYTHANGRCVKKAARSYQAPPLLTNRFKEKHYTQFKRTKRKKQLYKKKKKE